MFAHMTPTMVHDLCENAAVFAIAVFIIIVVAEATAPKTPEGNAVFTTLLVLLGLTAFGAIAGLAVLWLAGVTA